MIFISAGHYPQRPGAGFEDFYEHDEAVLWVEQLCSELEDSAMAVPVGVLKEKVGFINYRANGKSIAVEIHFNAAVDADGNNIGKGCETLYYPGSKKGKKLAQYANDALAETCLPDRGCKEGYYRMDPKRGPDFFLARTNCPAIIIEPDFIHRKDKIQASRVEACAHLAAALLAAQEDIYHGVLD